MKIVNWLPMIEFAAAGIGLALTLVGRPWLAVVCWCTAYICAKVRTIFPLNLLP